MIEYEILDKWGESKLKIGMHNTEELTPKARFFLSVLEKWGLVAAEDGGEDSVGRAKLKLPEVETLVARAADIADQAFELMRTRQNGDYIMTLPPLKQLRNERDVAEELRKARKAEKA